MEEYAKWIDVNDGLPKPNVEVLVEGTNSYDEYYIALATYSEKGWKSRSDIKDIVAWAYLHPSEYIP